jgi:hypothetical protein
MRTLVTIASKNQLLIPVVMSLGVSFTSAVSKGVSGPEQNLLSAALGPAWAPPRWLELQQPTSPVYVVSYETDSECTGLPEEWEVRLASESVIVYGDLSSTLGAESIPDSLCARLLAHLGPGPQQGRPSIIEMKRAIVSKLAYPNSRVVAFGRPLR